jgi:hypothetical protein
VHAAPQQVGDPRAEPAHPASEADEHPGDHERHRTGAQPPVGRRLLEPHEPGDLALPRRAGEQDAEQRHRRREHEDHPRAGREPDRLRAVDAIGDVRPPRGTGEQPGDRDAQRIAQRARDPGGEALEEVVAGDERGGQRDQAERRAEHDARRVRAGHVAHPGGQPGREQRGVAAEVVALAVAVPEVVVVELLLELGLELGVELLVRRHGHRGRPPGRRPSLPVRHDPHLPVSRKGEGGG